MEASIRSQLSHFVEAQHHVSDAQLYSLSILIGAASLETPGDREIFSTQVMLLLHLSQQEYASAQSDQNEQKMAVQSEITTWCAQVAVKLN